MKDDIENNKDLLDLCRLNQMEENVKESSAVDRDTTMKAIDWKKRHLAEKVIASASKEALKRHRERNTVNGKYIGITNEADADNE